MAKEIRKAAHSRTQFILIEIKKAEKHKNKSSKAKVFEKIAG